MTWQGIFEIEDNLYMTWQGMAYRRYKIFAVKKNVNMTWQGMACRRCKIFEA